MQIDVIQGDALEVLRTLPDESVHCCVTSPPYWGLRDYGVDGQLGLEPTPTEYVVRMIKVFHEVWRVLRHDGTLWLNIGDSYAGGGGFSPSAPTAAKSKSGMYGITGALKRGGIKPVGGLKPKDLCGIPWRLALALQSDGWYLRSDIVWHKSNPMPESVTDRPTKAHEYVFLLAKSERYYYDSEAIREKAISPPSNKIKMPDGWDTGPGAHGSFHRKGREKGRIQVKQRGHPQPHSGFINRWDAMTKAEQAANGRNKRDVWVVATEPFPDAHFATFPTKLITPCILAGCPLGGTVLDPFGGSGTTGVVAERLGRNAILIELNPEYVEMARRRIANEQAQVKLTV